MTAEEQAWMVLRDQKDNPMNGHTPAPWKLESDPYDDGSPYFRFLAGDPYTEGEHGFKIDGIMREADARLIAAAPLLFDLVQTLLDNDPDEPIADNGMTVLDGWRDRAKRVMSTITDGGKAP